MPEFLTFLILTLTTFFPMVDPFGIIPVFSSLTDGLPKKLIHKVALKACVYAFMFIVLFGFFGRSLFSFFGISTDGLKVVGGVLFFIMGYDMLQANISRTKDSHPSSVPEHLDKEFLEDLGLTPLAIPLICGPGAITNAILLQDKAGSSLSLQGAFILGTFLIIGFTYLCLVGSAPLKKIIGPRGIKVFVRLMGLLLMVLAVESFFSGLTPIVRKILKID